MNNETKELIKPLAYIIIIIAIVLIAFAIMISGQTAINDIKLVIGIMGVALTLFGGTLLIRISIDELEQKIYALGTSKETD